MAGGGGFYKIISGRCIGMRIFSVDCGSALAYSFSLRWRETNLPEFLAAGAAGFGIGGELICAGEAEEYRLDAITRRAAEFVRLIAQT